MVDNRLRPERDADFGFVQHEQIVRAVTDGEASHPHSRVITREDLAARRAEERTAALAHLGVRAEVVSLHCPDGGVKRLDGLAERLTGAACCFAPWERDGHPDHEAAGLAALHACAAAGVTLIQYPVWAWHRERPQIDRSMPWSRARRVWLSPEVMRSKQLAIAAYRSQIERLGDDEPILPSNVLLRFQRPFETFFV